MNDLGVFYSWQLHRFHDNLLFNDTQCFFASREVRNFIQLTAFFVKIYCFGEDNKKYHRPHTVFDWYPLVDPADRYPLRFSGQRLYCFAQTGVCGVHVVVYDREIKVLFVQPFDLLWLFQGVSEIPLLKQKRLTPCEIPICPRSGTQMWNL